MSHTEFPSKRDGALRRHKDTAPPTHSREGHGGRAVARGPHSPWGPARPVRRADRRSRARPCHPFDPSAPASPCHPYPRGDLGTLGSPALRACPSRRWGPGVPSRPAALRSPAGNEGCRLVRRKWEADFIEDINGCLMKRMRERHEWCDTARIWTKNGLSS